jgi:hypothetical protein
MSPDWKLKSLVPAEDLSPNQRFTKPTVVVPPCICEYQNIGKYGDFSRRILAQRTGLYRFVRCCVWTILWTAFAPASACSAAG